MPSFNFAKEGYQNKVYTMTQENETGVEIVMEEVSGSGSSSSAWNPFSNTSSSSQASTFTPPDVPTSCVGKTKSAGDHYMSVKFLSIRMVLVWVTGALVGMLAHAALMMTTLNSRGK